MYSAEVLRAAAEISRDHAKSEFSDLENLDVGETKS